MAGASREPSSAVVGGSILLHPEKPVLYEVTHFPAAVKVRVTTVQNFSGM